MKYSIVLNILNLETYFPFLIIWILGFLVYIFSDISPSVSDACIPIYPSFANSILDISVFLRIMIP